MSKRDDCADALAEALDIVSRAQHTWSDNDTAQRRDEFRQAATHAREWIAMLMEINQRR